MILTVKFYGFPKDTLDSFLQKLDTYFGDAGTNNILQSVSETKTAILSKLDQIHQSVKPDNLFSKDNLNSLWEAIGPQIITSIKTLKDKVLADIGEAESSLSNEKTDLEPFEIDGTVTPESLYRFFQIKSDITMDNVYTVLQNIGVDVEDIKFNILDILEKSKTGRKKDKGTDNIDPNEDLFDGIDENTSKTSQDKKDKKDDEKPGLTKRLIGGLSSWGKEMEKVKSGNALADLTVGLWRMRQKKKEKEAEKKKAEMESNTSDDIQSGSSAERYAKNNSEETSQEQSENPLHKTFVKTAESNAIADGNTTLARGIKSTFGSGTRNFARSKQGSAAVNRSLKAGIGDLKIIGDIYKVSLMIQRDVRGLISSSRQKNAIAKQQADDTRRFINHMINKDTRALRSGQPQRSSTWTKSR
jgi:hypothetical protein